MRMWGNSTDERKQRNKNVFSRKTFFRFRRKMFFAVCDFVFRSFSFSHFFLFSVFAVFRFLRNRNFSFSQFFVFAKFRKMKNIFPKKVFRATPGLSHYLIPNLNKSPNHESKCVKTWNQRSRVLPTLTFQKKSSALFIERPCMIRFKLVEHNSYNKVPLALLKEQKARSKLNNNKIQTMG